MMVFTGMALTTATMNERFARLDAELDEVNRLLAQFEQRFDGDGFEREELTDDDSSSEEAMELECDEDEASVWTVENMTEPANRLECDDSDCETIVDEWSDAYQTPVKVIQHQHWHDDHIRIPDDMEQDLEFLTML
jgi:hypothetical protein